MKRVLNSGSIKLPYVNGTENDVIGSFTSLSNKYSLDQICNIICRTFQEYLFKVEFKFEVKAPLLVYLTFQEAHIGTLNRVLGQDHQIAYLPPQFYKQEGLEFKGMDTEICNTHYTKLNNFFNWAFNFYNKLIKDGMCKEQAKLVLPQGIFVSFLWTVTARDLFEFITVNARTSPEMFGYCSTLVLYTEEHLPFITKWYKQNKWQDFGL